MSDTKIIWSGLNCQVGKEALLQSVSEARIVAGLTTSDCNVPGATPLRGVIYEHEWPNEWKKAQIEGLTWYRYQDTGKAPSVYSVDFDVVVDTYCAQTFDQVVGLAVRTRKPLVCCVSGLNQQQLALLDSTTKAVPVFYDGTPRFRVKQFIDEAVGRINEIGGTRARLFEQSYAHQAGLPSEQLAEIAAQKIQKATGKKVEPYLQNGYYAHGNWTKSLELQILTPSLVEDTVAEKMFCQMVGFSAMARNIIEIAKVMAKKPVKRDGFYTIDDIWDDIPETAKQGE